MPHNRCQEHRHSLYVALIVARTIWSLALCLCMLLTSFMVGLDTGVIASTLVGQLPCNCSIQFMQGGCCHTAAVCASFTSPEHHTMLLHTQSIILCFMYILEYHTVLDLHSWSNILCLICIHRATYSGLITAPEQHITPICCCCP